MNGAEAEAPRARPLSGGLWTLFSWLRRDERSSSESISSAGSAGTAVSFAFLAPPQPRCRAIPAPCLTPSVPSTDSYRRRVRDRNLRRQHERDLTLHRKYGLLRDGGYDALSLPPPRRVLAEPADSDRGRRATSEWSGRCAAHVPGKRRAPPPPALAASLPRRHARKRPAPQPPGPPVHLSNSENRPSDRDSVNILVEMNAKPDPGGRPLSSGDISVGCKSKYSKKDGSPKDPKPRSERSFLKQIFENKKRSSVVETTPTKILPNISELDKQAAEIIESCKLKALERNNNFMDDDNTSLEGDRWFCTRCLRKYNSTVVTCPYCLPEQKNLAQILMRNSSSKVASNIHTQTEGHSSNVATKVIGVGIDEKQKLKEMLKEMKDSLPKRQKHENNHSDNSNIKSSPGKEQNKLKILLPETPTLRIGSTSWNENNSMLDSQSKPSKQTNTFGNIETGEVDNKLRSDNIVKPERFSETVVITKQVVLMGPQIRDNLKSNIHNTNVDKISKARNPSSINIIKTNSSAPGTQSENGEKEEKSNNSLRSDAEVKLNIHTPLKISSLLNPVYIPKTNPAPSQTQRNIFFSETNRKIDPISNLQVKQNIQVKSLDVPLISPNLVLGSIQNEQSSRYNRTEPKEMRLKVENEKQCSSSKEDNSIKVEVHQSDDKPSSRPTHREEDTSSTLNVPTLNISSDKMKPGNCNIVNLPANQHSKRRDLINQLEKSIAKGDERAAAEAAVKLAQLKLFCSVLSFSSQIAGELSSNIEPDKASVRNSTDNKNLKKASDPSTSKVNIGVQSTSASSKEKQLKENKEKTVENPAPKVNSIPSEMSNKPHEIKDDIASSTPPVRPSTSKQNSENDMISIEVWVEDREATRGPVRLAIPRRAALGELRRRAEAGLGLAARLQRWIVGRALCTDDSTPLAALAGPDLKAPFYLCLVESETNTKTGSSANTVATTDNNEPNENKVDNVGNVYSELVQLEQRALVSNADPFECGVCMEDCAAGGGAVLRECVHTFCRTCLSDLVRHCEEPVISCPAVGCPGILQEREIRALVSGDEYERWLARGLTAAESGTRNAFHCRTRDCTGWALCDPGVRRFPCPVCKRTNCVPCQTIHDGDTCEQHRAKLESAKVVNTNQSHADEGTQALLDTLITKGEALQCPECSTIITKKWGCDWIKCSACKTEICWVTRGRRWGPGGRGDTTAGCRCGVDGKRCHPSCGYCH